MTGLLELAEAASTLRIDKAPESVRRLLRLQSLSVLSASSFGRCSPYSELLIEEARQAGSGTHSLLPGLGGFSLEPALALGVALGSALDLGDDLLFAEAGATAHWASWLGGAELGCSWDEVLSAQLAANELMGRLGGWCLPGRVAGQPRAPMEAFGAALVGGLLRGLSPPILAQALAIALDQAPGWHTARSSVDAQLVARGEDARWGWRAARLAEEGMRGPVSLLDRRSGFCRRYADSNPLTGWLGGVGNAWLSETLSFRLAPGTRFVAPAVEAMGVLLEASKSERGRPLQGTEVLRVDVDVSLPAGVAELLWRPDALPDAGGRRGRPSAPLTASIVQSLALVLASGEPLQAANLSSDAVGPPGSLQRKLASRIHVHHDWRLTADFWDRAVQSLSFHRFLAPLGPTALANILWSVQRSALRTWGRDGVTGWGPPGGGTGLAWSDLLAVLATSSARRIDFGAMHSVAGELLAGKRGTSLSRGMAWAIGQSSAWGSRHLKRWSPRGEERGADLAGFDLHGLAWTLPVCVRILEHGGRVWHAEVDGTTGTVQQDPTVLEHALREKFVEGLSVEGDRDPVKWNSFVDHLLGTFPGNSLCGWNGPGDLLSDLTGRSAGRSSRFFGARTPSSLADSPDQRATLPRSSRPESQP